MSEIDLPLLSTSTKFRRILSDSGLRSNQFVAVVSIVFVVSVIVLLSQWLGSGAAFDKFINILGIIVSVFAGLFISRTQLKVEIREQEQERLRQVIQTAARELHNSHAALNSFLTDWENLVSQFQIHASTAAAVRTTFNGLGMTLQNAMYTIVGMGPVSENPFGLFRYSNEFSCQNFHCSAVTTTSKIPPYPGRYAIVACAACKTRHFVKRDEDGSLRSTYSHWQSGRKPVFAPGPRADDGEPMRGQAQRDAGDPVAAAPIAAVTEPNPLLPVTCPHPGCGASLTLNINKAHPQAIRACTECYGEILVDTARETITAGHHAMRSVMTSDQLLRDKAGKLSLRCQCGMMRKVRKSQRNGHGLMYVECVRCGTIHVDENHIVPVVPSPSIA